MNFSHLQKSIRQVKGLTLLETLVSITVISVTIIGPLSFIATSSSYARQTKDALVATYLAEEMAELIQNQYDSLYVFCSKQPGIGPCVAIGDETSGQIAWRVFKERFSAASGVVSCYLDENADGCSFDYIDMQTDIDTNPPRYDASVASCSQVISTRQAGIITYVCMGLPTHINGGVTGLFYKRSVYLEHLPTFETEPFIEQDYDDIRVTAEVTYRAVNGSARTVKIVRYIHPRP